MCGMFSEKASASPTCSSDVIPSTDVIYQSVYDSIYCQSAGEVLYLHYHKKPTQSGATVDVCGYSPIPSGFLIVGKKEAWQYPHCELTNNNYTDAVIIRYPADSLSYMDICAESFSSIPAGWVITKKNITTLNGCSGSRWRIEKAVNANYTMCAGSSLPAGYIIYEEVASHSNCGGPASKITSNFGNVVTVCGSDESVVPSGYVVIGRESSNTSNCGGAPAYTVMAISAINSDVTICDGPWGLVIPSGMVIIGISSNYPSCGGQSGYRITNLVSGTSMPVCAPLNIPQGYLPQGYAITARENTSSCGVYTTGWRVRSVSSGITACHDSAFTMPNGWGFTASGQYSACHPSASLSDAGAVIAPINAGSYICANSPMPDGWVITEMAGNLQQCESVGGIAYSVSPPDPDNSMHICFNPTFAPIPVGYVNVQASSASICDESIFHSAIVIKLPSTTSETFVCGDSPIPENYAVTQFVGNVSICGSLVPSGFMISLLTGDGPYYVCVIAQVPAGYVVTARDSLFTFCATGGGYTVYRADAFSDGILICAGSDSPIPSGYVVTQVTTNGNCQTVYWSDEGYKIEYPEAVGGTTICNVTGVPIPAGYVDSGSGSPAAPCDPFSASTIHPENQVPVVPSTYIGIEADVTNSDITPINYDCSSSTGNAPFPNQGTAKNTTLCP